MFTGIIECTASVEKVEKEKGNLNISLKSPITKDLKVDQSLCHNGVCLTVVKINNDIYTVNVIAESLNKTCLGDLKPGDIVNLERSMSVNSRFDGSLCSDNSNFTRIKFFTAIIHGWIHYIDNWHFRIELF